MGWVRVSPRDNPGDAGAMPASEERMSLAVGNDDRPNRRWAGRPILLCWAAVAAVASAGLLLVSRKGHHPTGMRKATPPPALSTPSEPSPGISTNSRKNVGLELAEEPPEGGAVGVDDSAEFPSLAESTLMFLHVFKCAGSTLRRMLVEWAETSGRHGAVVHKCDYLKRGEICLDHYRLINEDVQVRQISQLKVIAGHFLWGFQKHVDRPHLMITALRNPLDIFVSGQQYLHKKKTKTQKKANAFVARAMRRSLKQLRRQKRRREGAPGAPGADQLVGFIKRFVGAEQDDLLPAEALVAATAETKRNLDTFWLVGVVEQYAGFEETLQRLLDPADEHRELWRKYASQQYNTSPVSSRDVLADIDPDLVHRFNRSLALQWEVYEKAVSLWDVRCREVLPAKQHEKLCTVPPAPASYR